MIPWQILLLLGGEDEQAVEAGIVIVAASRAVATASDSEPYIVTGSTSLTYRATASDSAVTEAS